MHSTVGSSYYPNETNGFVTSTLDALLVSGRSTGRTALEKRVRIWSRQNTMEDELILCDMMPFLLAGHDTTSGVLNI